MEARSALIAGATGLVGGHCLGRLLADPAYERVVSVARRPLGRTYDKLVEVVADFDRLAERAAELRGDDVFCCLGTTIKVAGSRPAFRRVDHDHVVELARLARANGARRFALVSSVGADAGSLNFYLRTKGETERDVSDLGYEQVELLRPSLLVGARRERRLAEAVAIAVTGPLARLTLHGPLRVYRPIEADTVAAAMLGALRASSAGVHVRAFDDMVALACQLSPA